MHRPRTRNAAKDVRVDALIGVQARDKHNIPPYPYSVTKIFYLCTALGGAFAANSETTEAAYFSEGALPPRAEEKCTAEQTALCFAAARTPHGKAHFD